MYFTCIVSVCKYYVFRPFRPAGFLRHLHWVMLKFLGK